MKIAARGRRSSTKSWSEPPFWARPTVLSSGVTDREDIASSFEGYVQRAYKGNGIVFACVLARLLVFSEARFRWRDIVSSEPLADLSYGPELDLLERPWKNGTTGELLARMEQDASLAGNFYATAVGSGSDRRVRRLRPDWVTILTASPSGEGPAALDAEIAGYIYKPQGHREPVLLTPDQVCHWSPIPDPEAQWRGMSWITSVIREVQGDTAATKHKLKFFENGATPSMVLTYDKTVNPDSVKRFAEMFRESHAGVDNAYRSLHLGGGADVNTVGANFQQLDFKVTQGAGETRIAAASGVGAVIANLSEGMQGSSLNAGNFSAARRRFADGTIRPNWRSAAVALESLVGPPPEGKQLWYEDRNIPFLREDAKDEAEILSRQMLTIESAVRAGYTPETAVHAVRTGDLARLKHTGLYSVQLQPPGTEFTPTPTPAGASTGAESET